LYNGPEAFYDDYYICSGVYVLLYPTPFPTGNPIMTLMVIINQALD
jgi:hypothetical protein